MPVNDLRISAVSYLNTTPLVWGLLHGPQAGQAELWFEAPSACAASVAGGIADVGIIPVIEMDRQGLPSVPGLGIASDGDVRSIFLISKVPVEDIQSLALDSSSRTSAALVRVILAEQYGVRPRTIPYAPNIVRMLTIADAALVIGDPALRLAPVQDEYLMYDLGRLWTTMTGLPMVYAMWAGKRAGDAACLLHDSYAFGRERIEDILAQECAPRGIPTSLARDYLTRHIQFELGPRHQQGLALYLKLARAYS